MWSNINVYKYQQIILATDIEDSIQRNNRLISIIYDKTILEVEHMPINDYFEYTKKMKFLSTSIKDNPQPYVYANGKKYKFVWDVMRIRAARYIEIKHFGGDVIQNMHKLFASMIIPMKKKWYGWVDDVYDASKHEEYCNDILHAKVEDVYGCVVFFYHVYRNWIEVSADYLKSIQKSKGQVSELATFKKYMDGNIIPRMLPTTKILELKKHMNYQ
jgi:hypothetical protein